MKIYNYLVSKKSNYLLGILLLVLLILVILNKVNIKKNNNIPQNVDSLYIELPIVEPIIIDKEKTKNQIINYSKNLHYTTITNLTEYIENNKTNSEKFANDIAQLKYSLENCNLKTNKYLIAATINKETKFQNIKSYNENDVFGFVQMKVSTIHFLKKLFPELPIIQNGIEFLNNVEAQVLYCDSYYYYISKKFNLNFDNKNDIILLAKMYNGGEKGYLNSKPSYYNIITEDYISLKEM